MKIEIKGTVPVVFFKEDDTFIAHCPVLELSSCGETFDAALASFNEALHLFLEECSERKTLEKVLQSCGWKVSGKKSHRSISPPIYVGQRQVSLSVPSLA